MLHDQSEMPTGSVTFLFTDIEGSTVRWERSPEQMRTALSRHDAIMREAIAASGGMLFQTAGDSFVVAFGSARPALDMALTAQRMLRAEVWPDEIGTLRVRMALHTGTATLQETGYEANHTLTRQARLLSTAHAEQILVSSVTRELLRDELPEGVELRDLGELRLKNLAEPQRVFQVVASAPPWLLPDDFPPPLGQQERPGNLPTSPVRFVGRAAAVADVSTAITEGSLRVTTLLGPGGIGKTSLALRAAERVQHHFADGAFFVDLAAVTDVDLFVPAIGSVLGQHDTDARSLAEYLRGKDLLLVLDNLEQVIDCATEVAGLLAAVPSLRVLATSRIPLNILSEFEYPVAPLELPDLGRAAEDHLAEVSRSEATQLFVQRATAVQPDFALTADNVRFVAEICHRLEGLPLALILAAVRLKTLTPAEMLDRLDRRLAMLTDGARDLPARHRALRAAIEWSYELLTDAERRQYVHWSVFSGGFSAEAAQAVDPLGDEETTAAGLASLVGQSLLVPTEGVDGARRYRMLETINEHGEEKLENEDLAESVQRAHADFFGGLAAEVEAHLEGEHANQWTARLEEEHDNFRAALSREQARAEFGDGESARAVVLMSARLAPFWSDCGHYIEGRGRLESALALVSTWSSSTNDPVELERAQRCIGVICEILGVLARRRGSFDQARQRLEQALDSFVSIGDERAQGRVHASLGVVFFTAGDFAMAREAHSRSLELSQAHDDDYNVVSVLLSLGNLERDTGHIELAQARYEEALEVAVRIHDLVGQSVVLNNSANMAIDAGELERARTLHLEALAIRHDATHRIMVAESMVGLASIDAATGEDVRAARLLGFADRVADEAGAQFDPAEQRLYDNALTMLGERDSDLLVREQRAGRTMTLEQVMELAHRSI